MSGAPRVIFHGTRGAIPTPEPANAKYGGNTACVEVVAPDGSRVFLDAGTGIRRAVPAGAAGGDYDIVLTHFHWDHVQGLPFFPPLHDHTANVRIHAPCQRGFCPADLLGSALAPIYFPVGYDRFAARCATRALDDGSFSTGSLRIDSLPVAHTSITHALRVRCGDAVIVYAPDNELDACTDTRAALTAFARGADLLIHDAMFTASEYPARRGWGHSSCEQALELACAAGVSRLHLFHHEPGRSDNELDRIAARLRASLRERGATLLLEAAREGDVVSL